MVLVLQQSHRPLLEFYNHNIHHRLLFRSICLFIIIISSTSSSSSFRVEAFALSPLALSSSSLQSMPHRTTAMATFKSTTTTATQSLPRRRSIRWMDATTHDIMMSSSHTSNEMTSHHPSSSTMMVTPLTSAAAVAVTEKVTTTIPQTAVPFMVSSFLSRPNHRSMITIPMAVMVAATMTTAILCLCGMASPAVAAAAIIPTDVTAVTTASTTLMAQTWYSSFTSTGFYQAFSLVFLSEIGDKTFFIAGLLAMKTNRFISFIGSISALIVMTILSVIIGQLFHIVPTFGMGIADGIPLDDVAAAIAFAFFGVKILKEAIEMEDGTSMMDEEFAEAEETVKDNEKKVVLNQNRIGQIISIFGLVFAAEFGDRSFVSTIALSAAQNPISVAGGAIAAHAIATGIAVAGGSVVAKYLSEKVIGIIGGTLFLVFAATTVLGIF